MEKVKKPKVITITLLGDDLVGKTELCKRFIGMEFDSCSLATIGVEKMQCEMEMSDGNKRNIKIWDTPGQERFRSMVLSMIRCSKGIILVFSVTYKRTFEKLDYWLKQIREYSQDLPVVLFGNKCDEEKRREVRKEEAQQYADKNGILYFEISAKNNIGVQEGFKAICDIVYKKIGVEENFKIGEDKKIHNRGRKSKNKCKIY